MTPLAQRIVREMTLPTKHRSFNDRGGLLRQMDDVHCFECTDVLDAAKAVALRIPATGIDERSSFLPAPKTWIEFRRQEGGRVGCLVADMSHGEAMVIHASEETDGSWGSYSSRYRIKLGATAVPARFLQRQMTVTAAAVSAEIGGEIILALLAFINSPRVIGRRQHMPHRGLEKRLLKAAGIIGRFPLHAWTEIKLHVKPPTRDASGDGCVEAHYTGQRALHFCRAHLRISAGRLQVVRAHWRGDASLGIKRSRYLVTP